MNRNLLSTIVPLVMIFAGAGCNKSGKLNTPSKFTTPTGPMELKLKWPQGERVVQSMEMKTKLETSVPGQPAPVKQDMTMGQKHALKVLKEDPDGGHEVEMEFLSARMAMDVAGRQQLDYDSTRKSPADKANPVADMFGKIVGARIKYYLDASNNVERIEGVNELMDRLSAGTPAAELAPLKTMFSESYFRQMMSSSRFMPPKAVSPGDSWPVQLEFPMEALGTMELDYTFTLQSWEMHGKRNCARLEFQGTVKTKPGPKPNSTGMTVVIKDGNCSGISWFDPELGITIDTKMDQDMTMTMTLPRPPQARPGAAGQPQTTTTHLAQSLTIKLDTVQ